MEEKDRREVNGIRILMELGGLKLSRFFCERPELKEEKDLWNRFDFLLLPDAGDYEISKAEYEALIDPDAARSEWGRRLLNITAHCGTDVALTLLELIMLRVSVPGSAELLEKVSPGNGDGVTLLTAARVSGYTGTIDEAMLPMREAMDAAGFLFYTDKPEKNEFFRNVWHADLYLLSFLSGGSGGDPLYEEFIERFNTDPPGTKVFGLDDEIKSLGGQMEALLDAEDYRPFSVIVQGEKESGRYTLVRAASGKTGLTLLSTDFEHLLASDDPREALRYLVRSCSLEGRALCVRGISRHEDTGFLIQRLYRTYRDHSAMPLILLTDPSVKLIPAMKESIISMKLPEGSETAFELWKGFLPEEYSHLAASLSSKMKLNAGQLKKVSLALDADIKSGKKMDEHGIIKLCYKVLDDGRYDNVKWIEPGFKMEDLKIDAVNRSVLEDIVRQAELGGRVYDDWGLKRRYAYGRCVSVLLSGPPGTGKTMTVHALASRLGLELYKVDLSQITDKYVGETEKRLEEVFTRAEKSNMILFFDEADAVMGKRSEVRDAQDKYANTEISFILQRLEEYDGIVILATNNIQNIDTAFIRRIRYILVFQRPDKETRLEIWQSAFDEKVPLSEDVDFDYLAEQFELSGGEIKNIVLNAVFYAAAEDDEVSMKHIMKAIYREMTKGRRVALNGDYGKYGYMLRNYGELT